MIVATKIAVNYSLQEVIRKGNRVNVRKNKIMSLYISEVENVEDSSKLKECKLSFKEGFLTNSHINRLMAYDGMANLEIGIVVDYHSSYFLNVKQIKWFENKRRCDLVIDCRSLDELDRIKYHFKEEARKRRMQSVRVPESFENKMLSDENTIIN